LIGTGPRRVASGAFGAVVCGLVVTSFFDAGLATALVTLFAVVVALIGIVWQVSDSRQRARSELSYSYYERWSRAEMLCCRATVGELLNLNGTTSDQRWTDWSSDSAKWPLHKRLQALVLFAFFEELAGQYNRGALDKQAAAEYLGTQAIAYWRGSDWFIGRYRMKSANFCNEWKHMLDAISKPIRIRQAAGETAAAGCTPEEALELDFDPPPLSLP